ncbi:MAG: NAD-dependent epimerase/dehydratase family protein [Phototrophicaceae bacterium]
MILVTGATGFIGRNLVRQLLAQGLPVRCLLPENRARRLPWDAENAAYVPDLVLGNLLDDEALYQAVTGVHTIIHLESAQWWGSERNLERIELAGTRNLVSVARAARVGRIITLSHLGASSSSAYVLHRIKGQVEEIVRNSGLAYTILRSGIVFGEEDAFMNNMAMMLATNPVIHLMPGQGEIALHPIYIDDLVQCIIASLESLDSVDNTLEIGGPEYITYEDLLLTLMRITGNPRLIIPFPPYTLRFLTRIYGLIFPRSLTTPQWLDILATNRTTQLGNTYTYFGVRPRRIEDTLVTYMQDRNHLLRSIRTIFRRRPRSL